MLLTEWNWDDALAVRYEEGIEDGWEKSREEIARKMKVSGLSMADISKFTDLPADVIERL